MTVVVTGESLTLEGLSRIAFEGERIELSDGARAKIGRSREVVEEILRSDRVVYGINTGFGNFRKMARRLDAAAYLIAGSLVP